MRTTWPAGCGESYTGLDDLYGKISPAEISFALAEQGFVHSSCRSLRAEFHQMASQ